MKYLYPKQVHFLHDEILRATGGLQGLQNESLLESAVLRPMATFGGNDLYPDIFTKTAVLMFSLIQNHPFADGNKRTGYIAGIIFLKLNGYDLNATIGKKVEFTLSIARGKMSVTEIATWLSDKCRKS